MRHGTTIYYEHANEDRWLIQLSEIEEMLSDFGASRRNFWGNASEGKSYCVRIKGEPQELPSDAKVVYRSGNSTLIVCSSLGFLIEGSINEISVSWVRPIRYPCVSRKDCTEGRRNSGFLSISVTYCPTNYAGIDCVGYRGVWKLNVEVSLDPHLAQVNVERHLLYAYPEVWDYYELVKRIHSEVGFHFTGGSFLSNYYQFGESEGDRPGFDSLFRFDRSGPSRVILPFEERRPFHTELDENGKNELSFDPQTGLYRCVVETGPV